MAGSYSDIIKRCKKNWNYEQLMDGAHAKRGDKIPFSSPLMNWCTYGGIPRNKMTEFIGVPGGGKTTTSVDICKNAIQIFETEYNQKVDALREKIANGNASANSELSDLEERGPKKVLYVDLEHSFDEDWSVTLGIDCDKLDIMQPPDVPAEEIVQTVQEIVESGELGLIVLDSVPSLVTQAELDKKFGERTVASLAGLMTTFCRKIVPLLSRYETTLIFINQLRVNMDNPYVVKTPGGEAIKFYSSLRINFKIGAPVDFLGNELPQKSDNPAGYLINAQIIKQKSAPWDRKQGTYYLMCDSGIRPDFDYAKLAISKYGIIKKGGAWFTLCDPYTGEVLEKDDPNVKGGKSPIKVNGLMKVYDFLNDNPEYYEKLKQYILDDINGISKEA